MGEDNKADAVDSKKELKTKIAANKWGPLGSKAKSQKQGQVLKLQKTFELAKIRKKRAVERTSKLAAKEAAVKHHLAHDKSLTKAAKAKLRALSTHLSHVK